MRVLGLTGVFRGVIGAWFRKNQTEQKQLWDDQVVFVAERALFKIEKLVPKK